MRITKISVKGLFGTFDHTIPLNLEDRITVIHGPNGFGKTILLKMLDNLFQGDLFYLLHIPFQEFEVDFDNEHSIRLNKNILKNQNGSHSNVSSLPHTILSIKDKDKKIEEFDLFILGTYSEGISWSEQLEIWINEGQKITEEMFNQVSWQKSAEQRLSKENWIENNAKHWIKLKEDVTVHLIETQRILMPYQIQTNGSVSQREPKLIPRLYQYSEELKAIIKENLSESALLSQSLDSTFPTRLVNQLEHSQITTSQLEDKLNDLRTKRRDLIEIGILDEDETASLALNLSINEDVQDVLSIYIRDMEEKLSTFDALAAKIKLLKDIVNRKFLYKEIKISKDKGFFFITTNNEDLHLSSLSSGEQHELVLLYQLIFSVPPNSLVLIDEPELSLHIVWQAQFLKDLQKITQIGSFDTLVTTHSPDIIDDRWDLTVELKGPQLHEN